MSEGAVGPTGMSGLPQDSLLGRSSLYADQYAPELLFPIARLPNRQAIGVDCAALPFMGADLWTAFELSWLGPRGKPQVAIAHITVPCETPYIVESKSLKLYLASFSNTVMQSAPALRERLCADIGAVVWGSAQGASTGQSNATVGVRLLLPEQWGLEKVAALEGRNIDRLDVECTHYMPAPELLVAALGEQPVSEVLSTDLLKSNCLVTHQPDWGSLQVAYSGPQIDEASLLRYVVSLRNHNEFHEQCVERIFMDITRQCRPIKLAVLARYTRRGGLDINPFRTSHPMALPGNVRLARQ